MSKELNIEQIEMIGVMSTKDGRNVLHRVLNSTSVEFDSFSEDPYRHAHNAGKRSVGLQLKSDMQSADLDLYITMVKEHE